MRLNVNDKFITLIRKADYELLEDVRRVAAILGEQEPGALASKTVGDLSEMLHFGDRAPSSEALMIIIALIQEWRGYDNPADVVRQQISYEQIRRAEDEGQWPIPSRRYREPGAPVT